MAADTSSPPAAASAVVGAAAAALAALIDEPMFAKSARRRCDQLRHHDEIGHQGPPASWKPGGRPVTIEPSAKAIAIAPTRPAFPRDLPCVSPVRLGTFQPGSARSARWPRRLGRRCVSEFAKCRVGTSTVDGGRSTVHQDGDPDGLSGFLRCSAGPYRGLGV